MIPGFLLFLKMALIIAIVLLAVSLLPDNIKIDSGNNDEKRDAQREHDAREQWWKK